jgi:hypothetical protein
VPHGLPEWTAQARREEKRRGKEGRGRGREGEGVRKCPVCAFLGWVSLLLPLCALPPSAWLRTWSPATAAHTLASCCAPPLQSCLRCTRACWTTQRRPPRPRPQQIDILCPSRRRNSHINGNSSGTPPRDALRTARQPVLGRGGGRGGGSSGTAGVTARGMPMGARPRQQPHNRGSISISSSSHGGAGRFIGTGLPSVRGHSHQFLLGSSFGASGNSGTAAASLRNLSLSSTPLGTTPWAAVPTR